jgi:class II lanthipeptide synthase
MVLSEPELARLVAQASTLHERLGPDWQPDEAPCHGAQWDAEQAQARLANWRCLVAPDDPARFEQRLARDGLDASAALGRLCAVRLRQGSLPAWADTLQQALQAAGRLGLEHAPPAQDRCTDPKRPLPFEDVFLPFVHVARQRLAAEPDIHYGRLSPACQAALERALVRVLSIAGAQTLLLAFAVFRATRSLDDQPALTDGAGKRCYLAFVSDLMRGGLRSLLQEYSMLARLLATQTDGWVEATREFLRRLRADWPRLVSNFGFSISDRRQEDQPLGEPFEWLVGLKPGLSDPHHGGRSVIALEFDSGLKLIYKPRDLGLEAAYQRLVVWLNDRGLAPHLKPLAVLNCGTHGWAEFVERRPCMGRDEAAQFYQRAGASLALMHALGGTDCHYENLIASGAHPVLIEHEMLMCPDFAAQGGAPTGGIEQDAVRLLSRSVLGTGLLPTWEVGRDGQAFDASGLGNASKTGQGIRHPAWKHVNTDDMARVYETVAAADVPLPFNVPTLEGVPLSPGDHLEDLITGFRRAYDVILEHRQALLAGDGPLAEFSGQVVRVTVRKTSVYLALLQEALAPRFMRDGADYGIRLDRVSRAWLSPEMQPTLWPISRAEHAALARMDVPRFTTRTDSHSLDLHSGGHAGDQHSAAVENCFPQTGYHLARAQIVGLSQADLEQQIGLIRASLIGLSSQAHPLHQELSGGVGALEPRAVEPLTNEQMVEEAGEIATALRQQAIRSAGEATWLRLDYDPQVGYHQLAPLGYALYSGSCGVALFLAALSKVKGERAWGELALAALQPVRQAIQGSHTWRPIRNSGLSMGGADGLGSVIYSLTRIGQLLGDATLLQDARRAVTFLTPERIAEDKALDVILGAAGAILGLLAVNLACGDPASLERAIACGKRLLQARVASDTGHRAWPTLEGKLLTGFSHGAAGIAYALLRLYAVTGEVDFRAAAEEAFAYEHVVGLPQAGSWCHGAAGVGLARLGGLGALDTKEIRADIEVALETTLRQGVQRIDHLCCGTGGQAEFLLAASTRLARPELAETARRWASQVVRQARQSGNYAVGLSAAQSQGIPTRFRPGFFQGLSGIGYWLLHLAAPMQVPAVLLWE